MFIKLLIPATLAAGVCAPAAFKACQGVGSTCAMVEAKLKLSAQQKTAFHDVFKGHKPALATKMEALVLARNAAMDAGMDPVVTQEAWQAQQEQMATAIYDLAKEVRSAYLEALPILTEAQKNEGKVLLKKTHGHMEGMHGRHHVVALRFLKSRLELTDGQVVAVQTVLDSHKTALTMKREILHRALAEAVAAALDPATPQNLLDQRFGAMKEAGFALSTEVRAAYLEILPQLTPDQREAAKGLARDFRNAVDSVRRLALGF